MDITAFEKIKYKKLGGVLVFYVISLFISLLFSVISLKNIIDVLNLIIYYELYDMGFLFINTILILIVLVAIFILISLAIYRIFKKSSYAKIKLNVLLIAILNMSTPILTILIVSSLNPTSEEMSTQIAILVGSLLYLLIWNLYFAKSKRVHVYFNSDRVNFEEDDTEPVIVEI